MSRVIRIYNTQTTNRSSIESAATNWADLQRDLANNNVGYSGLKAVIGESELTLESPSAILPEGEFTLFLMPSKVKSGITDWNDDEYHNEDQPYYNEGQSISSTIGAATGVNAAPQAGIVAELRAAATSLNNLATKLEQIDFTLSPEEMEMSAKARDLASKLGSAFS